MRGKVSMKKQVKLDSQSEEKFIKEVRKTADSARKVIIDQFGQKIPSAANSTVLDSLNTAAETAKKKGIAEIKKIWERVQTSPAANVAKIRGERGKALDELGTKFATHAKIIKDQISQETNTGFRAIDAGYSFAYDAAKYGIYGKFSSDIHRTWDIFNTQLKLQQETANKKKVELFNKLQEFTQGVVAKRTQRSVFSEGGIIGECNAITNALVDNMRYKVVYTKGGQAQSTPGNAGGHVSNGDNRSL
jgi:hypothetical protein